ncbi:MAG TPA: hypothetical protein VGN23_07255 [Verrucomicrobiae bacterium]
MHLQCLRHDGVGMIQKPLKFSRAVPPKALADDIAGCEIQGSKQGSRPIALVFGRVALDLRRAHRQHWLGPVEGLNPALFINA